MEYLGKLSPQQVSYFFIPKYDLFLYDQVLSYYWLKLSEEQRSQLFSKINAIEE